MAASDDIQVGDLVNVPGSMYGTVRYLGTVAGKPGKFAGIELAAEHAKRGKNNGDVDGRKYFMTSIPGSGIFVPMNNSKYVTKRVSTPMAAAAPQTPIRPSANFSKSAGPSASVSRPKITPRRPSQSQSRPESPRVATQPLKLSLNGLRTPSASRTGPSPSGFPRSPVKAPSRASDRPSSRVSAIESELPPPRFSDVKRDSTSSEVQELKDQIRNLEKQLRDRDAQLDEQAHMLTEFQKTLEEVEGSDVMAVRAQLREKNEKISQLTAEFDAHRADFRSTLDTLEIAASETERVYEQRLDEIMQQNRELQDRGEDVEVVARQLKQLEELVSELEEGLEDARRGEAEARAEVEFLRGEVERTKLELKKERDNSAAALHGAQTANGDHQQPKGLDQKDDEIRGLKAIIHSLSKGDPNFPGLQNGLSASFRQGHDSERVSHLEHRIQEYVELAEAKTYRIEELERELQQLQLNGTSRRRGSTVTMSQRPRPLSNSSGNMEPPSHARQLSDRTVVPIDLEDQPGNNHQFRPLQTHRRGLSDATRQRLETMHENDSRSSDEGSALWCEVCETSGHDILHCTSMFGADVKNKGAPTNGQPEPLAQEKPTLTEDSSSSNYSTSSGNNGNAAPQRTGRDAVAEGLKGIGSITSSMAPVAGKASGVIDESKWCALCERDGHESIDCPFDD